MFGEALKGSSLPSIFLATKVSYGDKDHVFRSVEASLKRLGRESVDLIQIHGNSYSREQASSILGKGGMLEAMEDAEEAGRGQHARLHDRGQQRLAVRPHAERPL